MCLLNNINSVYHVAIYLKFIDMIRSHTKMFEKKNPSKTGAENTTPFTF